MPKAQNVRWQNKSPPEKHVKKILFATAAFVDDVPQHKLFFKAGETSTNDVTTNITHRRATVCLWKKRRGKIAKENDRDRQVEENQGGQQGGMAGTR
jgi:hypothetical protein